MTKKMTINTVVHVNDETTIIANRVPSADRDFASVKLDWDTSILLFNPAQAKALADAAVEAFRILKQIEADEEANRMASVWNETVVSVMNCTPSNPCQDCRELDADDYDGYYEYEDESF